MKSKTIRQVIRKKVNEWLKSIDDDAVRKLAEENTIVTGGCIASMLLGEKVNDFDLYFRNKATVVALAEYYVAKFKQNPPKQFLGNDKSIDVTVRDDNDQIKIVVKSAGVLGEASENNYQYFENVQDPTNAEAFTEQAMEIAEEEIAKDYRPVFLSSNAITLSGKIQLILRFYGEPDEIHKNYDFVHCTNFWISQSNELVLKHDALEALLARELVYVGSRYPLCSIIRTRKFIKRGYSITAGQYLKMVFQLNQLDLTNLDVLEDQLTGVDVAYFGELIEKLRAKDAKKVDGAYLMEIVNRMF